MRRLGEPSDVAPLVLFLASDAAGGWITGQTHPVNGGFSFSPLRSPPMTLARPQTVHHRRKPWHRPGDRSPRRAGRSEDLAIAAKTAEEPIRNSSPARSTLPQPPSGGPLAARRCTLVVDVRDDQAVGAAVAETSFARFGGIDICINNASAIALSDTLATDMKRFDLEVQAVNARGTYAVSRACLPWLLKSDNPHILTLSPPLGPATRLVRHPPALHPFEVRHVDGGSRFGGVNSATPAQRPATKRSGRAPRSPLPCVVEFALGGEAMMGRSRIPEIIADAAHCIVGRPAREQTGRFFLDDEVLSAAGVTDFDCYRYDPSQAFATGHIRPR